MSKCLERNKDFLKSLLQKGKKVRSKVLSRATKDNIHCLTEIAHNLVRGKLAYQSPVLKRLKNVRKHIRELAKSKKSIKRKKEILIQHGGFLPLLLEPVIAAIVGSITSKVISNVF